MNVAIRAFECFVSVIFYSLLPCVMGYALGWIMCKEKLQDKFTENVWHLKNIIVRLYIEGKISDSEKVILEKAVDELQKEKES